MKAKNLIKILKKNPEALVVLSKDPEGNGFSELCDVDGNSRFNKEDREIGIRELNSELIERGYSEEDLGHENWPECFVLWP